MKTKPGVKTRADILIHPIGELVTANTDREPIRGHNMQKVRRIKNAALAIGGDNILAAGPANEVLSSIEVTNATRVIDATEKLVTPGLIDPHTHLIFAGNRADEFIQRCQGKTYAEIANSGGGIVASMKATRKASVEELVNLGLTRLKRMLAAGTTTCEVKTGYGLDPKSELRMLETIWDLAKIQPVELVATFMPAHAIPPDIERGQYLKQIIEVMLPSVASICKDNNLSMPFADVFCDKGYLTVEESRHILQAAISHGMLTKIHADEFVNLGATELGIDLKATSVDHLLKISNREINLLAKSNTIAVLLPGTSFYLNLDSHAPARKMIDAGVAVAIGSDFNPGSCHIFSLPFIWGLACLYLRMTPEEVLTALTVNAAFAINKGDRIGQLRSGYQADVCIFDVSSLEEVPYNLGWNPVIAVIKRGRLIDGAKN